jgi:putative transposase
VLGLWIDPNEGAKFWLRIVNELRNRGVKDILIAVVDGLKGFPEAINAAFPQTLVQTCIVHLLRNALAYVSWQDRRQVVAALKPIYQAPTADAALAALDAFEAGPWGRKYQAIAPLWRRQWDQVIPFFAFPPEVRRIIYTTNAIESLNSTLRTAIRSRGHFPNDEAETFILDATVSVAEALHHGLNHTGFDWKGSREMARRNAQALWDHCTFQIPVRPPR